LTAVGDEIRRLARWGPRLALLAALALPASVPAQDVPFDHYRTRFPLVGAHERVDCERCHAGGVFRGTPTRCIACHDGSGVRADTARDVDHIRTTNDCDSCHLITAWAPSRVDHDSVLGDCATCHDGRTAEGRPLGHPPSSNRCEECHGTITWMGARFDHTGITSGCVTCHDGSSATGKPPSHPPTSNQCEDCHTTFGWEATRFDHTGITNDCVRCHNGMDATGKSPTHVRSTNVCEACHRPGGWSLVSFDHTQVLGSCSTCHDGATATGKPPGHFQTAGECDLCHLTQDWQPVVFRHSSPAYPGDHRGPPPCQACHTANAETIAWPFPTYQPDCAACHASDFKPDSHKKVDSPTILYTVDELRDCTGACHQYTDATFTTIERTRTGEHRPGSGDW
jgi:hypothetical protein